MTNGQQEQQGNAENGMHTLATDHSGQDVHKLLALMAEQQASDLYLNVGARPHMKVGGITRPVEMPCLPSGAARAMAYSFMTPRQIESFESSLESNLALHIDGLARFRVNVYFERGEVAVVFRLIRSFVPEFRELGLPSACENLSMLRSGLVLVVGSVGSGKSTTLASMVNYRAAHKDGKILTIEDPIEYMFSHQKSLVSQREVGVDTLTFGDALRNALRASPDVIMIGEIRDQETAKHALNYADTGHLCLATLHATNASQAIERLLNFFPEDAHHQMLMELSLNLGGVIAQRLLPGKATGARKLVTEVLLKTAYVAELIQDGKIDVLADAIKKGDGYGMHTFDQSLFESYRSDDIDLKVALDHADSRTDLSLRIRMHDGNQSDGSGLSMTDQS